MNPNDPGSERSNTGLIDPFGRHIEYVRLSVTDRCNLRCTYCMPKGFDDFEIPDEWLSFEEIEQLMQAFASMGLKRIRLTGGEPLVRRNLPELISRLSAIPGIEDLSLSSNAVLMERQAQELKQAGVTRLNISLDTLRADRFTEITGGGRLDKAMAGLMAAKAAGFAPIKINMVAMKGVNDDEYEAMVDFCIEHDFTLRFIETMPVGSAGRWASSHYHDLGEVRKQLKQRFDLVPGVMSGGGPARYERVNGTELRIGFITPISRHFCETCNRVRLSADGQLYLCLGQNARYDLRKVLRSGVDEAGLQAAINEALALKPQRHEFKENPEQVTRLMSMTGG
ncbi:MAG: GTP 3',8-cyclase MoaA [Proteobacteria bacterium]|nr:GTP 3',8-cyclase MoaA [Pseudomonadota bacterium]